MDEISIKFCVLTSWLFVVSGFP